MLVSACLLGEPCRYDGTACTSFEVEARLHAAGIEAVPVCPETMGGLPTPREPVELSEGRAMTRSGVDATDRFALGARLAVERAKEYGCRYALLKERSPSCGCTGVYDGTFSGALIEGSGLAAAALADAGVSVYGESQVDSLINDWTSGRVSL